MYDFPCVQIKIMLVLFVTDAEFLILAEQNHAALGEVVHNILEHRIEVLFVLKFVEFYKFIFYDLKVFGSSFRRNKASTLNTVVLVPELLFYIFVPCLPEKQYVLGASSHKNFVSKQYSVAEVLNLKFLMMVRFDIFAIDSKRIALSIEALNNFSLGIVETFLREIFATAGISKFMIDQRLIHLFLFRVIRKMVMHLDFPMKAIEKDFIAIYEAAVRKRLIKSCDR